MSIPAVTPTLCVLTGSQSMCGPLARWCMKCLLASHWRGRIQVLVWWHAGSMFWDLRASTPVTQQSRVGVSCSTQPSVTWGGALLWQKRLLGTSWRRVWRGTQSRDVQCEGYWRCPGSSNLSPRRRPPPQMCLPCAPMPRLRHLSLRPGAVGQRPCPRSSEKQRRRPRCASTPAR